MQITLKDIEKIIRAIIPEQDLQPAKYLGRGLWELPGGVITNEGGYKEYMKQIEKEIK